MLTIFYDKQSGIKRSKLNQKVRILVAKYLSGDILE